MFCFKQKTAYEMRISDWSSDVCSADLADATLVPTRELRDFLGQGGFENVKLLPRAVDTRQFHPAFRNEPLRQAWGAHGDAPVAIHVGRIAAEKNLPLAVRAFRELQRARPDARFARVGAGPGT